MTENAYSRAVGSFEALLSAPRSSRLDTPAALIKAAGLPPSSGYRHVATLEAEGFLRRDETGTYLLGQAALRSGLKAHCLGRLAPAIQPILLQIRQATQVTAFLGYSEDLLLRVGPHSIGRETRHVPLQESFSFETVPVFELATTTEVALVAHNDGIARRSSALLHPVQISSKRILHLGILTGGRRGDPRALIRPLELAGEQFSSANLDAP